MGTGRHPEGRQVRELPDCRVKQLSQLDNVTISTEAAENQHGAVRKQRRGLAGKAGKQGCAGPRLLQTGVAGWLGPQNEPERG